MARPYRLQAENSFYHVTSRGDDRKRIFLNETDYGKFLEYLKVAKERFGFYLYAYCLMSNHYHLFLEVTQANLSKIMHFINTSYTIYYNIKRKRCGHLFQGRFKSILVEADSYFSQLTRYIHLNPVKANITEDPEGYRWSSYRAYITSKADDFIDSSRARSLLSMDPIQYRQFVLNGIEDSTEPLKHVYAGFMLGGVKFIKENLDQIKAEIESKDFAHKRAAKNTVDPQKVIGAVADYFKLDSEQMCKSSKRPMTAKKMALYLLRRKTGLTNAQIGELFDMKLAAVSKAALSFKREIATDRSLSKAVGCIISKVEV